MKGGGFKVKGRELTLLLIVLACTTIIMLSWERTPLLSASLPANDPLQTYSEISLNLTDMEEKDKVFTEAGEDHTAENPPSLREAGDPNQNVEQSLNLTSQGVAEGGQEDENTPEVGDKQEKLPNLIDMEEKDKLFTEAGEDQTAEKPPISREAEGDPNQNVEQSLNMTLQGAAEGQQNDENTPEVGDKQVCNYAKGKWVVDDSLPLYSGFDCKQWLAPGWACRLMQRTEFSYEKLRWQPKDCTMERFNGDEFLKRMRGKTLAFVGDSLGRQQFQSLMCMITGGLERNDVLDVGSEYGLAVPENGRPDGWAYRFPTTNTTVLYYWSSCLSDVERIDPKDPNSHYAMHLDRPPAFLRENLHRIHVLVLNTGHHWNRGKLSANRWVMHVGGVKNTNKRLSTMGDLKNFTIHSIVSWVNSQLPENPQLQAFYRSISPRHFSGGEWNTGGSCDSTIPMSIGKEVADEESKDYSAWHAVQGTGVKILDITSSSKLRDEGHISRYSLTAKRGMQDCLHWCLPGVPDSWNEILFAQIK
ncbi:unnamed protein product [Linum tenue]|uniref:Trichome birefringence-like N-terminal domain-containing protein n=1 Tax=Linum tenue TaxID=586396 RepID=A0AAV0MMZ6_9ROSI|nr:unnamed protein product [Linum tenue]